MEVKQRRKSASEALLATSTTRGSLLQSTSYRRSSCVALGRNHNYNDILCIAEDDENDENHDRDDNGKIKLHNSLDSSMTCADLLELSDRSLNYNSSSSCRLEDDVGGGCTDAMVNCCITETKTTSTTTSSAAMYAVKVLSLLLVGFAVGLLVHLVTQSATATREQQQQELLVLQQQQQQRQVVHQLELENQQQVAEIRRLQAQLDAQIQAEQLQQGRLQQHERLLEQKHLQIKSQLQYHYATAASAAAASNALRRGTNVWPMEHKDDDPKDVLLSQTTTTAVEQR